MTGLAARQAELIAALTLGGLPPAGIDSERIAAVSRAILGKRADAIRRRWPLLVAGLDADWLPTFTAWSGGRAARGSHQDGWELATELNSRGLLPVLAQRELAIASACWYFTTTRPPRPRRFGVHRATGVLVINISGRIVELGRWIHRADVG